MATIYITPAGTWKADIRSKKSGQKTLRLSRTFDTEAQARAWSKETEASIKEARRTGRAIPTTLTLREAISRWKQDLADYIENDGKRGADHRPRLEASLGKDKSRIKLWENHSMSSLALSPHLNSILIELNGADGHGEPIPRIGAALDEPVFGPLLGDRAYRLIKVACDALGIKDFRWHDLRHEACSRLAERGWTAPQIQSVSGHKTLASLSRYTHIQPHAIHSLWAHEDRLKQALMSSLQAERKSA